MVDSINIDIGMHTPCRMYNIYADKNGEIEINNIKLKGIGRTIWIMLNGKNTIDSIATKLCSEIENSEIESLKRELIYFLSMLQEKNLVVMNWDPLYKYIY